MQGRWIRVAADARTITLARVVVTCFGLVELERREYARALFPETGPVTRAMRHPESVTPITDARKQDG